MHAETTKDQKAAALAAFADLAREPGVPKPDPILVVDNVVRRFGGLTARFSTSRSSAAPSPR
jgi:branched-chain amino acid transport system ATP-binding protein